MRVIYDSPRTLTGLSVAEVTSAAILMHKTNHDVMLIFGADWSGDLVLCAPLLPQKRLSESAAIAAQKSKAVGLMQKLFETGALDLRDEQTFDTPRISWSLLESMENNPIGL